MNGYYIKSDGSYYEGDRQGTDQLVPRRPSSGHIWNGTEWIMDMARQRDRVIKLMQSHLDAKAVSRGFDHILSAASYENSSNPVWKAEGIAFRQWRDDVWAFGLALLASVAEGTNTITTDAELIASLPVFPLD